MGQSIVYRHEVEYAIVLYCSAATNAPPVVSKRVGVGVAVLFVAVVLGVHFEVGPLASGFGECPLHCQGWPILVLNRLCFGLVSFANGRGSRTRFGLVANFERGGRLLLLSNCCALISIPDAHVPLLPSPYFTRFNSIMCFVKACHMGSFMAMSCTCL